MIIGSDCRCLNRLETDCILVASAQAAGQQFAAGNGVRLTVLTVSEATLTTFGIAAKPRSV